MNKKCKQMMGAVLLMASFSQSGSALATSCAVPPTCEQLGYKMKVDDCGENPVLRCPFALSDDNQVYCSESAQNQVVSVGAILYGDGTVASGLVTGKTPIGIVFDTANRLAVALTDINSSGSAGSTRMYWSTSHYDIPALGDCYSGNLTTCEVDGRANTTAILNCGSSCGSTPAATATNSYEPSGCSKDFCKKTKWFLPSMRDLITLYSGKNYVNASLSLTSSSGAKTLTESDYYWSSTEDATNSAWRSEMRYGYKNPGLKGAKYEYDYSYVRPVLAF